MGRNEKRSIKSVFAEKNGEDEFTIKRGYAKLIPGRNVLVVEDVLNEGKTVRKVIKAVRALKGNVVAVGAIWNRGEVTALDLSGDGQSLTLISLVNQKLDWWSEEECPLCMQNIPINREFGKGKEFLARSADA